jgi:hypothetical protein
LELPPLFKPFVVIEQLWGFPNFFNFSKFFPFVSKLWSMLLRYHWRIGGLQIWYSIHLLMTSIIHHYCTLIQTPSCWKGSISVDEFDICDQHFIYDTNFKLAILSLHYACISPINVDPTWFCNSLISQQITTVKKWKNEL